MRYWQYLRVVVGILEHNHKSTIVKFSWRLHIKLTAGITGVTGPWKPKYLLEIIGNVLRGSFSWFSFLRSFWQKAFLDRRRKGRFCSWSQKSKISSGSQDVFERSKDSDSLLKPKNRLPSPVWQPPLVDQSPWEANILVCLQFVDWKCVNHEQCFCLPNLQMKKRRWKFPTWQCWEGLWWPPAPSVGPPKDWK